MVTARLVSLLVIATASCAYARDLPSYVKACKLSDPNLNECALRNGRQALPYIIKGDPSIRLPSFEPLVVSEMAVRESGLNIVMRDVKFTGIGRGNIVAIRIIPSSPVRFEFDYFAPKIDMAFNYNVSGKILVLPISGLGPGAFHLTNVSTNYKFFFDVFKKNGVEYMKGRVENVTSNIGHLSLRLEKLFNGDKFLGENTNKVLNENWEVLLQDFGPAVTATLKEVAQVVVDRIVDGVPYKKILLT